MELGDSWKTLTVDATVPGGRRLDAWLAATLPGIGRRAAARMIETGRTLVDGRTARKATLVFAGQIVRIMDPPPTGRWSALPDPRGPLPLLRVDEDFLVVDKPAGIPSTPRVPDEQGTLAGRVAARFPECAGLGRSFGDSGLLQRLDRETSGAVLVARGNESYDTLLDCQRRGLVAKSYLALVRAARAPLPAEITVALGPAGPRGGRSRPTSGGRLARTAIDVLVARGDWMLVRAVIHRGARHQIRAHLAWAETPIAGDGDYGGPELAGLERTFLHAARLEFPHPRTGEKIDVASLLPADLVAALAAVGIELVSRIDQSLSSAKDREPSDTDD